MALLFTQIGTTKLSTSKELEKLLNQTMEKAGTGRSDEEVIQIAGHLKDLKDLLDDPPYNMSNWDYEFIENVSIAYEELRVLSEKQIENIERLHAKFDL